MASKIGKKYGKGERSISQTEEVSQEKGTKDNSKRFNYAQDEEKSSENKYRKDRIKTDYLNLDASKSPCVNV